MKRSLLSSFLDRYSRLFKAGLAASLLLAVGMLVPLKAFASQQARPNTRLHHFQLPCDTCHKDDWYQSDIMQTGTFRGDINRLCTLSGCHVYDRVLNHPVGVRLQGQVPSDMKTDDDSRLTCLTCHKESNVTQNIQTNAERERFLQVPDKPEFCGSCHTKLTGRVHWQFSNKAHLGTISPGSIRPKSSIGAIGDIDVESRTCLSCHDDITGSIPFADEPQFQKYARGRNMSDHPIGVDYTQIAIRQPRDYRFLITDDGCIRLFDGRVGCGSCHSLYADNKAHIVIEGRDDILCRTCHIK